MRRFANSIIDTAVNKPKFPWRVLICANTVAFSRFIGVLQALLHRVLELTVRAYIYIYIFIFIFIFFIYLWCEKSLDSLNI